MNLYEILIDHYSPKDHQQGIFTYLVADSDEEVYEWLKTSPRIKDGRWLFVGWEDYENDDDTFELYDENYNVIGTETFKEKIIRLNGDLFDEDADLSDLYYGRTLIGWKLVKEDISNSEHCVLIDTGISLEFI